MIQLNGRIITPTELVDGYVLIEGEKIVQVSEQPHHQAKQYDFNTSWIVPGFIDLHMHGLGPFEPTSLDGLMGMAQLELQYGTTSFLPTGAAMSVEQYIQMGQDVVAAQRRVDGQAAKILGVHLEGPFINTVSSGAMDSCTRRPITMAEAGQYVEKIGPALKIMTFSPELANGMELIKYLHSHGIVAGLGHSVAGGEQIEEFVEAGLRHVVHMFNAFVPSGETEPGVLKAGLIEHILANDALTCEFICDLHHVAPLLLKIAAKLLAPHRFVAITDSLVGAGLEDGIHAFPNGGQYQIADGVARLCGGEQHGKLAGSVLTMNQAFANLIRHCGINPVSAAKFTATNAARVLRIDKEIGSIEPGKCADLAVLNSDYHCIATFVNGALVYQNS